MFQFDIMDSIPDIIGGLLATLFAILSWYLVEKLNEYKKWKTLVQQMNELYRVLDINNFNPSSSSVDFVTLAVDEIGEKDLSKILKLRYHFEQGGAHVLEGNDFVLLARIGTDYRIEIRLYGQPIFDYRKPKEGVVTYEAFRKYFQEQCKKSKINLAEK